MHLQEKVSDQESRAAGSQNRKKVSEFFIWRRGIVRLARKITLL